jgi:acetyltransferase-like isoleucine patch superfamily enzyme
MIKKIIYFSPLGLIVSLIQNIIKIFTTPFMVYGYWNRPTKSFRRLTRVSSSAVISDKENINISENCWIWHHSILDGSNGIEIEEGVQIGAWVGIFTHSSHAAVRLHGNNYINIDRDKRIGYLRAPVKIGAYSFVGAGACILPGVVIGKGSLIGAGAIVSKSVPEFSIVHGNPAKVVGSTLDIDKKFFDMPEIQNSYFDPEKIKDHFDKNKSDKS